MSAGTEAIGSLNPDLAQVNRHSKPHEWHRSTLDMKTSNIHHSTFQGQVDLPKDRYGNGSEVLVL